MAMLHSDPKQWKFPPPLTLKADGNGAWMRAAWIDIPEVFRLLAGRPLTNHMLTHAPLTAEAFTHRDSQRMRPGSGDRASKRPVDGDDSP